MFNTQRNTNMFGAGQPQNNTFQSNNVFGNNNNTQGNIFNKPNNQPNNTFPQNNNQTGNIFGQGQNNAFNNQPQGGGIFNQGNNNQNTNIFGQNNNNPQGGNMFNQPNQQTNNIFGQQQQQQQQNFNQNNQQQANIFGQNNQQQFGQQTNQQTTFFNNTQQGNMFQQNNPPMVGAGNNPPQNALFPAQFSYLNLMNLTPEQQQQLIRSLTNDQIRKFIDHYLKSLVEPKKLENLALSADNNLKNEKVNALANKFNIKAQLLQIKKEVRDKVNNPLKDLKQNDQKLVNSSAELAFNVRDKLQKYKESLIEAISQNKMLQDIKREIGDIDTQIREFLKPLFNSHQTRSSFSFIDPDQFCIRIAEQVLKNISYLDNKMDELLACEGQPQQEAADTGDIIERLVEYYENVVVALREFAEKYQKQKKEALSRRRMGNVDDTLRRIVEKANTSVRKELKAYELVKEIEQILQKREKKGTDMMME